MIGDVVSLLAGHLLAGSLIVAAVLSLRYQLPPAFLRFCTSTSAVLGLLAALLGSGTTRWLWLLPGLLGAAWYAALRQERGGRAPAVLSIAASAGVLFAVNVSSSATTPLTAAAANLTSGLLLGAVTVTMVLGHWYLVDTSLSILPLRQGALWFWGAIIGRWLAVAAVLLSGGFQVLQVHRAADVIYSTNGLFFLFRGLMGLAAPLVLAGLVWQTVKIRSTQSATGLLYVALMLVLFGELVSHFLQLRTGYPL